MRLIDADELKTAFPVCDNSKPVLIASVRATINHMPTIEPEIVRCKDCKYWIAHDKRCVYLNHGFAPNMWCCHGERKTDE